MEVRVEVTCAAICRTDLFAARGIIPVTAGRVLGHEAAGVVVETGADVTLFHVGDAVILNPLLACGTCASCRSGAAHDCWDAGFLGVTADGAFAQRMIAHAAQLIPQPEGVSPWVAAYAEPLAAAMAVLHVGIPRIARVGVSGQGRIADLTELVLRYHGFEHVLRGAALNEARCVDYLIESDIADCGLGALLPSIRPAGTLVLKSRSHTELSYRPVDLVRSRLRVVSALYAPFAAAIELLPTLAPALEAFIGKAWSLCEFEKAFAEAEASEAKKVFFAPQAV
jgi:L-iditol 2-dehydrogenase